MSSHSIRHHIILLTVCADQILDSSLYADERSFRETEEKVKAFLEQKHQYELAVRKEQNIEVLQKAASNPKKSFVSLARYGGRGNAGSWLADVNNPGLEVTFENGADVESRSQEKQDLREWESTSDGQTSMLQKKLFASAEQLMDYLSRFPWWKQMTESVPDHLRKWKYQEAKNLTEQGLTGGDDFLRGMEYFLRLDDYKDADHCFLACSRKVYLDQAVLWLKVSAGVALAGMLICWVFGYAVLGYQVYRIGRFWSGVVQSIPAGIILFGIPALVCSEIVAFVLHLTRKMRMKKHMVYTSSEEEWELI